MEFSPSLLRMRGVCVPVLALVLAWVCGAAPVMVKSAAARNDGAGVGTQRQVCLVPTQPLCLSIDPGSSRFGLHLHFDPLFVLEVPSRLQEFPQVILDYLPWWREMEINSHYLTGWQVNLVPPEERFGWWLTWMCQQSPLRISPELPYVFPEGAGYFDIRGDVSGGYPYVVGGPMPPMPAYGPLGLVLRMAERGL